MKEIYSKEEIKKLYDKLDYKGNFGDVSDDLFYEALKITGKEYDQKEYIEFFPEFLKEVEKSTKEGVESIFSGEKTTKEKILIVIDLVKKLNKEYLLKKFEGKLDEQVAERIVEYGYTHGGCVSLQYTLKLLFPECNPKFFQCNYAHKCVELNGMYYDITGASTEKEMMDFVIKEGGNPGKICTISDNTKDCMKSDGPQSYFEYALCKIIKEKEYSLYLKHKTDDDMQSGL